MLNLTVNRENVRIFKSSVDGKFYQYAGDPAASHTYRNAGVVMPTDISNVEATTILQEVQGRARPLYNLRKICRVISMDSLECTIPIATKLTVQRKVPPMVEPEVSNEDRTYVTFKLWKNVGHIVCPDETMMLPKYPIFNESVEECSRDLPRAENLDIKDATDLITEKVSSAVYDDWGAKTSGVSDTDPFDAITAHIDYIQEKGYPVNFMGLHNTLWSKFCRNTYVRDLVHAGMATLGKEGGSVTLPGYPTINIVTDYALPSTPDATHGPIIGHVGGMVFGEGPLMAEGYRDSKRGGSGYEIRQWLEPKVVIQDALSKLCT
jgi:hypothetical protein